MKKKNELPSFFYITGCDGTGKSTQAYLLLNYLRNRGLRVKHVWLRFPFFLSAPFLFYARQRKMSWYEVHEGKKFGYWDFRKSWLLRKFFPWIMLLDAFIIAFWKIYLPLFFGWSIVCERFALDMIVDLCVGYQELSFLSGNPGRLFQALIPMKSWMVVLNLDRATLIQRRPDLAYDHVLEIKLDYFRTIAEANNIALISTIDTALIVNCQLLGLINDRNA